MWVKGVGWALWESFWLHLSRLVEDRVCGRSNREAIAFPVSEKWKVLCTKGLKSEK